MGAKGEIDINTNGTLKQHGPTENDRKMSKTAIDLTENNAFYTKHTTPSPATTPAPTASNKVYDGCYTTKGCFGLSSNPSCVITRDCDMVVTYRKNSTNQFMFELGGVVKTVKTDVDYVALGISETNKMAGASVMACSRNEKGLLNVTMYWNPTGGTGHTASVPLDEPHLGLSQVTTSMEDDFFSCTFLRESETSIAPPSLGDDSSVDFDLSNQSYYLLLALGPMEGTNIGYHSGGQVVSGDKVNLAEFSAPQMDKNVLITLHAGALILAWLLCGSFGTFFARYCKDIFQSSTLMGGAVWFKTHKLAMIATLVLSVLGMVPVFIDRKLEPIKRLEYHPMVGLATIAICLCQPVIAYFRPGKDHPWRPVFYGVHSSLGHLSIGLALAAVYLTQTLANPLDQSLLPLWGMYASYGLGIWIVANHLFQTFYQCNKAGEAMTTLEDDKVVKTGVLIFTIGLVAFTVIILVSILITEI